jgi:hypothetical protein
MHNPSSTAFIDIYFDTSDNFKCRICNAKDNKGLRLEIHHAKSYNDICNENNITTLKQAIACKEIWGFDNVISLCYGYHRSSEKLRTKMKNMFVI